jgi:hypothetical protein
MSHKAHIEHPLILAAVLCSLAGLAGCGGSQAGVNGASTSSSRTSTRTVAVASAAQSTHTGTATKSDSGKRAPEQDVAKGATRTSTRAASQTSVTMTTQTSITSSAVPARHLSSSVLRAVFATYASCLRAHGVNLPQPNTTGRGPIIDAKGIDTKSSAFKRASALCAPAAKATLRAAEAHDGR